MPRLASILALALAGAAMPAAAQYDGGYGPPAGAPPVNTGPYAASAPFTGLRVEGQAGWDRLQDHGHKDGVDYGVAAGYDVQYRRAVLGVEGELADSSTKVCGLTGVDTRLCVRSGRDVYVGGRIGTAVTPQTLLYAKAGYTNARVKLTEDDGVDRFTIGHRDLDGVRVGAGAEYQLFANAYVKAEYRYSNYEDHLSRNQIVGGFGVRF